MDNTQIAKEVIKAVGGLDNVNSVAHCATRLRVMVKDEKAIDKDAVDVIKTPNSLDDFFCNLCVVHLQKTPFNIFFFQ